MDGDHHFNLCMSNLTAWQHQKSLLVFKIYLTIPLPNGQYVLNFFTHHVLDINIAYSKHIWTLDLLSLSMFLIIAGLLTHIVSLLLANWSSNLRFLQWYRLNYFHTIPLLSPVILHCILNIVYQHPEDSTHKYWIGTNLKKITCVSLYQVRSAALVSIYVQLYTLFTHRQTVGKIMHNIR